MAADQLKRGRRGRRQESSNPTPTIAQRPFEQLKRPYQAVPIISDDQVEHIHQASLKLLSETGLDILQVIGPEEASKYLIPSSSYKYTPSPLSTTGIFLLPI